MKVNRGDVEQPDRVVEWHATRTTVPTEVAYFTAPNLAGAPLNPVHEYKSSVSADIAFCRVCWEETNPKNSDPLDNLVQPCLCRGSQANIHLSCLRAWQRAVMENAMTVGDERAFRCGVCKATYAIPPEPPAQTKYKHACLHVIRLALVIASSFSLYCGIDNAYMWPMLGFIALVLPTSNRGVRAAMCSSILLIVVVLRFLLPYSDIKSSVTVMAEVSEGIIGEGAHESWKSPQGAHSVRTQLKPGTLLLAGGSHSGAFSDSAVVFLFSHSSNNGSQGVMLNQRIRHSRTGGLESGCFLLPSDPIAECERVRPSADISDTVTGLEEVIEPIHYFGGPVFALERIIMMHMFSNVVGSREILLARDEEPGARANEVEGLERSKVSDGFEVEDGKIFLGGLAADVLAQRQQAGQQLKPVWIFHGVTTWNAGQLVDEIENGAWIVKPGTLDDLLYFSKIFGPA